MATRRAFWPKSRLNGRISISAQRHDPPVRCGQSALGRRNLASHAPSSTSRKHGFSEFMPPRDLTELDILLHAIQRRDTLRISEAFVAWTDVLGNLDSPFHEAAVRQAQELPGPTFSEILRNLDPVLSPSHDVAHGLNLTLGQTQFIDTGNLLNEFGVRDIHRKILSGMEVLVAVRCGSPHRMVPADYEIAMKCAGAAADYQGTKAFFTTMASHGLQKSRTTKSWSEFIKARFMIEPVYYQFDRSRVAVLARDLFSNIAPLPMETLKHLDKIRFSMNDLKREPWNRRPDEPEEDMRRLFRRRLDYKAYKGHWIRSLYYGHEMDEELLCTSMIAFAKSSSLHSIKTMIFQNYYRITIKEAPHPADTQISGGRNFLPDSLIKPSPRLLHAITEAFGSMSHIALGMKLLDFVSRRYDIPIPHETWSNLLNWTYICASKPFQTTRKIYGSRPSTMVTAADVRQIWHVMTSEPYNITPTFEDLDIYIKVLIAQRSFGRAISAIRDHAIPHYNTLTDAHQTALFDQILQNDSSPSPSPSPSSSRSSHHLLRAQLLKDHAHNLITSWLTRLLKSASQTSSAPSHRNPSIQRILIPNLLLEFSDFFHPQIRYRTPQGLVQITRPDAVSRFDWARRWRMTLPQKKAGIYARDFEGSDHPEFPYPRLRGLRVLEWGKVPRGRSAMPLGKKDKEWWGKLEEQLML